jgi:hypothetical protein
VVRQTVGVIDGHGARERTAADRAGAVISVCGETSIRRLNWSLCRRGVIAKPAPSV